MGVRAKTAATPVAADNKAKCLSMFLSLSFFLIGPAPANPTTHFASTSIQARGRTLSCLLCARYLPSGLWGGRKTLCRQAERPTRPARVKQAMSGDGFVRLPVHGHGLPSEAQTPSSYDGAYRGVPRASVYTIV